MEARIERERTFHNERFSDESDKRKVLGAIRRGATSLPKAAMRKVIQSHCLGKTVLDYGCGPGNIALKCAKNYGAQSVVGIDCSDAAIEQAHRRAEERGIRNATFRVADAEATGFADDTFDLVCGTGILHHLNLTRSVSEIARILKPGGTAVFLEPLGHNVAINVFRRLTPQLRTPDEHPLLMQDLKTIREQFASMEAHYFSLTTLIAMPLPNFLGRKMLLRMFGNMDGHLFRWAPFLKRYAWCVVLVFSAPRSERLS